MKLLNNLKYIFFKRNAIEPWKPVFTLMGSDLRKVMSSKTQEPFDLNGRQIYTKGPDKNGVFTCERLSEKEKATHLKDFKKHYSSWGTPHYEWVYKSTACNSFKEFRLDIYSPGRMRVRCTLPKYSWAAVWLYCSMNKGDFDKPLLGIDKPEHPREYYWEIDLFETMMNPQRIVFSGHYGTQTNRKLKTDSIYWKDDGLPHEIEVNWDGTGWWTWFLDDVPMHVAFIPQPKEKIYPYLLCTLGMWDDYSKIDYPVNFKIEWIKFSSNMLFLTD